jgi:hypothetical protein
MGMFDLKMKDDYVEEYRQMVKGMAESKVTEPIVAAALFRRGGHAAKMGISKARLGALAYAGAALTAKKQAGGLPERVLLVATQDRIRAFKAKMKGGGRKWEAEEEVAAWDRAGLKLAGRPSSGLTMLDLETTAGDKLSLAPIGVRDDPLSLEFIQALSS